MCYTLFILNCTCKLGISENLFYEITCISGGPGGLYFTISMKLRNPEHEITVKKQNMPHNIFFWGIVFSDQTLENLLLNDTESAETIFRSFAYWDDIDVHINYVLYYYKVY